MYRPSHNILAKVESLPVMSREDWAPQTQDNMKQWRHGIVHHFANFDEAHEKMTNASNTLYDSPVILYITIPKASPDWSIFDASLFAENKILYWSLYFFRRTASLILG